MNKKLNVLLIPETKLPPVSRANLRLFNLGQTLIKKRHIMHMIVPSELPHKRESGKYEGIYVHQFPGFNSLMYSKIRILIRTYHLIATILYSILLNVKYKFDAVHSWHPLANFAAIHIGQIIKRPVFVDYTDFYSDIAKRDSPLTVPVFNYIEKKTWMESTKVVVVSEEMKRKLLEKLQDVKFSSDKIVVVPDGVNADMFNPSIRGDRIRNYLKLDNCPVCIYHGDIKYFDGVDILLCAFKKVIQSIPDAKLLILGGGGVYFNDEILPLLKELDLEKSVILTGWVDHNEVPEYISAADVGVMPLRDSLNNNTFYSFKLFEYWGVGKPVVVTNLKTISTIVKNEINGILVQPENIDGVAKALTYLLNNPETAKEMGAKGRKLVEKEFNWKVLMEKEALLYEGV